VDPFNDLTVALISIKTSLPSSLTSKISYGRNNEYNSVVRSMFDTDKWDADRVVIITVVDLSKNKKLVTIRIYTEAENE